MLREDSAQHRPLVGLLDGIFLGSIAGLFGLDFWTGLAGAFGAGLGGFIEALIYRDVLEENLY